MRNKLLLVALAVLTTALFPADAGESPRPDPAGSMISAIKGREVLRVAQVTAQQQPFFYLETVGDTERWVGFEIDLAQTIADRLGVKLEIVRLGSSYNEVCEYVQQGRADIGVSKLSVTPARRRMVDFANPYIVGRLAMIINLEALERDKIDAIDPDDLNRPEVKVTFGEGMAYEANADQEFPKAQKIAVKPGSFEEMSASVVAGEAHVLLDNGFRLILGMSLHPELSPGIHLYEFNGAEFEDPLGIAVPKNQPEMLEFINGVLDEIENIEPTTLEYLVEKYLKSPAKN